jgi:hypothetical protein
MQAGTHTPVTSGLGCSQRKPGPHTAGGFRMFPSHGPPSPETQPHALVSARASHVAPLGQAPPHIPPVVLPHGGATQSAAGPGQQVVPPGEAQMQPCSQVPLTQLSAVQALPSLQSASVWQVETAQDALQNSFGWPHGRPGAQASPVHFFSMVSKQPPTGGGTVQVAEQNSFGSGQRWIDEQGWPVHRSSIVSKQPPGVGGGHFGLHTSPAVGQGSVVEHATSVHCPVAGSAHRPRGTAHAPSCALQVPAARRWQSLG